MSKRLIQISFILFITQTCFALENICPQSPQDKPKNLRLKNGDASASMSYRYAQAYFNEVKKEKYGIAYDYVADGCDMRALYISKILKDNYNLPSFRVALEKQGSFNLYAKTPHTIEGGVEFPRHTATGFCVQNPKTGRVEPYILDPSFFTKPVRLDKWRDNFTDNGQTQTKMYYGSMYSLDPRKKRSKFHAGELKEAKRLKELFLKAQSKMRRQGCLPEGVGRFKANLRENINQNWCRYPNSGSNKQKPSYGTR